MLTHYQMVKKMLKRHEVKAAYDAQVKGFALLDELLRARQRTALTQAEAGKRTGPMTGFFMRVPK